MEPTKDEWGGASETAGEWSGFSLVIDTDAYAGNFEREMLAACTGVLTEYPTGYSEDEARRYDGPDLEGLVGRLLNDTDDRAFADRCAIYPTPGWENDGNGEHRRIPQGTPPRFLAYQSVRVALERMPTPDELVGIKRRAIAFASRGVRDDCPFVVEGFRFVRDRIVSQSRPV